MLSTNLKRQHLDENQRAKKFRHFPNAGQGAAQAISVTRLGAHRQAIIAFYMVIPTNPGYQTHTIPAEICLPYLMA